MGKAIAKAMHKTKIRGPAIAMKSDELISMKSYVFAQQANAKPDIEGNNKVK